MKLFSIKNISFLAFLLVCSSLILSSCQDEFEQETNTEAVEVDLRHVECDDCSASAWVNDNCQLVVCAGPECSLPATFTVYHQGIGQSYTIPLPGNPWERPCRAIPLSSNGVYDILLTDANGCSSTRQVAADCVDDEECVPKVRVKKEPCELVICAGTCALPAKVTVFGPGGSQEITIPDNGQKPCLRIPVQDTEVYDILVVDANGNTATRQIAIDCGQ